MVCCAAWYNYLNETFFNWVCSNNDKFEVVNKCFVHKIIIWKLKTDNINSVKKTNNFKLYDKPMYSYKEKDNYLNPFIILFELKLQ